MVLVQSSGGNTSHSLVYPGTRDGIVPETLEVPQVVDSVRPLNRSRSQKLRMKAKLNRPLPPTPDPINDGSSTERGGHHITIRVENTELHNSETDENMDAVLATITGDSHPPRRANTNLRRWAEKGLAQASGEEHRILNELLGQGLESAHPNTAVKIVIDSRRYRDRLTEILGELDSLTDARTETLARQEAISKDEQNIVVLVRQVLRSEQEMATAMALRGSEAESFMDALENILNRPGGDREFNCNVSDLFIRLSKATTDLPESMFISGVDLVSKRGLNAVTAGGSFGDVFKSTYQGRQVALKRLRVVPLSNRAKVYRKFCKECRLWHQLNHPNILPFLGIDAENYPRHPCMVSPWMSNGTILDYLKKHPRRNIDRLLYGVAKGVYYLHSEKVVHGDIKGANILIDGQGNPLLADFGLTVIADTMPHNTTDQGGTARFMAPELLLPERFNFVEYRRTFASDVYAFGCLCIEIYTRQPPFPEIREFEVIDKVLGGGRPGRPIEPAMTDNLWDLVNRCWHEVAKRRPKSSEIITTLDNILRLSATASTFTVQPNLSSSSYSLPLSPINPTHERPSIHRILQPIRTHADPARLYHNLSLVKQSFSTETFIADVKDSNSKVKIKQIIVQSQDPKTLERLVEEFLVMRFLPPNTNVINYEDAFQYDGRLWIVMDDILPTVTLRQVVQANPSQGRPVAEVEAFLKSVSKSILQALEHLHRHEVRHGYIDPDNVVFSKVGPMSIRLRMCGMIPEHHELERRRLLSPPELAAYRKDTPASDIWNLGVLVIDILASGSASDVNPSNFLAEFEHVNPSPSAKFVNYLHRIFQRDPAARPTATELLQDPFLSSSKRSKGI